MITNTTLQTAFTQINRDVDSYIEIAGVKYGATDLLKDLKLNCKADKDGQWIGRAIPKMLKAEIVNDGVPEILSGAEIKAYFGLKVGEAYQYIHVGNYYAQPPEYTEDKKSIKLTAYDKLKAMQSLEYGAITYPITVGGLADLIATKGGVTVDKTNLLFQTSQINKEIYFGKDKTVIELINALAQMSMTFAYIDYGGTLRFKRPAKTAATLSDDNVFKFRFKDFQKAFNVVVISRQPQNDDVALRADPAQVEDIEVKLSNNPILDLDREGFISTLLDTAKALPTYTGLENLVMQSNPLYEVGDIVTFRGKEVAIFEHEITMTRSTLKSQIAEKTETDYKKAKGLEEAVRNTELYVDKVAGEIKASISTNVDERLTELRMTEEGITQRVSSTVTAFVQENEELLKGESGADFQWNLIKDGHFNLASSYVPADQIFLVYRSSFSANESILKFTSQNNTAQRLERRVRIEEKGTYTYTFRMKVSSVSSHVGEWKMFVNASAPATTQDIPASEWATYQITFTVDRDATDAYADKLLRFYIPTLEAETTVEIDWEKLVKSDRATTEFVPNETEIQGKDGKDGLPGPKGEDGKDAAILSATAPADKDQLWFDLNTNEMKYWDTTSQAWKEVTWELESRVATAESKITNEAIINTVSSSEKWAALSAKADAGQTAPEVQKLIDQFGVQELTSDKLMTKISSTTTWTNLQSTINSKVDSGQVSTQINTWASQEITASKLMSKISGTKTWTDQTGKITQLESRSSSVEQTLNDFKIEFNQSSKANLLPSTFNFTPMPTIYFGGAGSYTRTVTTGDLEIINEGGYYGEETRIAYQLARDVALNGQYFTLSGKFISTWNGNTRLRFRFPRENAWKYADVQSAGNLHDFSVTWQTNLTDGSRVGEIYFQVYNKATASGTTKAQIKLQGQSLKLEEGRASTPWTRAESEMIRTSSYTFDEKSVRFTYDGQDKLVFDGMTGNLDITGRIHATGGTIGAWDVYADGQLIGRKNGVTLSLDPRGLYNPIQYNVGTTNYFSINRDGSLYSRSADMSGSFAGSHSGSGNFTSGSYAGSHSGSGSFTSGSYAGNHSGYGNFGSGSYTGSGYFSSGSTIAGYPITATSNGIKVGKLTCDYLTVNTELGYGSVKVGSYQLARATSTNNAMWISSDVRLKEGIADVGDNFNDLIYSLPIISYALKDDKDKQPTLGINANLVDRLYHEDQTKYFIRKDPVTERYEARYTEFIPMLIKTIQDLNERLKKVEGN